MDNKKNDRFTQDAYGRVVDAFKGDRNKANEFMHQNHRSLGGRSPMEMIGQGRARELARAIKDGTTRR